MTEKELNEAQKAAAHWEVLHKAEITPVSMGWINRTFFAKSRQGEFILQKVNPIFSPLVHEDIEAVTRHLQNKGLLTPRLVGAKGGMLFVMLGKDCWRLQTFIKGTSLTSIHAPGMASSSGQLVGRFHLAVSDLVHEYRFSRSGVHDTAEHLRRLQHALEVHKGHRLFTQVEPVAREILEAGRGLPDWGEMESRHSHGDLKISNILFEEQKAICLVDLDTLGRLPLPLEMGDAFRSWCNPGGEEQPDVYFDLDLFKAALEGYAEVAAALWSPKEKGALVAGLLTIVLELSARFIADALNESYFQYDPSRYASWGEHSLLRGKKQWALYLDAKQKQRELSRIVDSKMGC